MTRIEVRVIVNGTVLHLTPGDARDLYEHLKVVLFNGVESLIYTEKKPTKTK